MSRNKLKAFVRYDGKKNIVPSSLILQAKAPKVGTWSEIPTSLCCKNSSQLITVNIDASYPISYVDFDIRCDGGNNSLHIYTGETAANITELIDILNTYGGKYGKFTLNENGSGGSILMSVYDTTNEFLGGCDVYIITYAD